MVFHQNGTTLTYWANDNTDWNVRGIISNAINPVWVILLTFPLVWFWKWLDRTRPGAVDADQDGASACADLAGVLRPVLRREERRGQVTGADIDAFKVSPLWLIGAYGVLTLGELMLSPMGLSLVSKVAPRRLRGVMMGGWFVATASATS